MFTLEEILKVTRGRLIQKSKNVAIENISIDSRTIKPKEAFIALKGFNFDGHNFIEDAISKGASCVLASNKEIITKIINEFKKNTVRFPIIYVKDTLQAFADLAGYNRRRFSLPLIAITGTNGKTTTKDMTAAVLSSGYRVLKNEGTQNNKIGLSLSLLKLNKNHDIAVLELGTNHLGEIKELARIASVNLGIITNIGPGHLEFFSNIKNIFTEKSSLFRNLQLPAICIINADDLHLSKISNRKMFSFGIKNKCDVKADNIVCKNGKLFFMVNKKYSLVLNSVARHNVYNALAAVASGLIFGVGIDKSSEILAEFNFSSSRMDVLNLDDITILDDTCNSNPVSLKAAIDTLIEYPTHSRRILVMADMLELGKGSLNLHRSIGKIVAKSGIDHFIAVGNFSKYAAEEARKICKGSKKIASCDSSEQATSILLDTIENGDVILIKGSRAMHMEKVIEDLKVKG